MVDARADHGQASQRPGSQQAEQPQAPARIRHEDAEKALRSLSNSMIAVYDRHSYD
jgi:hypothetical protein